MGCGSSSLKGSDIPNLNSQPTTVTSAQQIKKIGTNFSDVDYDQNARQRRMTEYAPHEQPPPRMREESRDIGATEQNTVAWEQWQQEYQYDTRPDRPGENSGVLTGHHGGNDRTMSGSGPADRNNNNNNDGDLRPYQTMDGGDWDNQDYQRQQRQQSYANGGGMQDGGGDPTSDMAKNAFATANDPANPNYQDGQRGGGGPRYSQAEGYNPNPNNANDNDHDDGDDQQQQQYDGYGRNMSTASYANGNPDIHDDGDDTGEPKKGWFSQKFQSFQSSRRPSEYTDEDLIKYTGKDRTQLRDWAQNRPGVGPNQEAGRVGTDNGLAAGAAWN
ncbi:hypothetical protein Z517_09835 [Fonsecaea pedrosoi CBS 271.37]|uniref:Uncharacterized protein n=1 Tax=Fonsecaea pedrosoi CBS 271.37 TaxID=1442368 RepID=A0A0D2GYD7_9EURO|nr:uncharacterized protein Z517_09835 [Fonsecaea pedrosoi CBS 271.37]KIW77389.1 hypothetical protein Z517_09835 [Fonsecaea pedrosoi CBS 271.37]